MTDRLNVFFDYLEFLLYKFISSIKSLRPTIILEEH